ncbi:MAG: 3-oxoacyl-[acyl-carrier protein] reductase, partial [uncultured Thermomicrobiales bacterium]
MRDAAAVQAMVDGVVAAVGVPAVAVANTGVYPTTPFLDLSPEEWDLVLDTNLKGVFLTCQAAARAMAA